MYAWTTLKRNLIFCSYKIYTPKSNFFSHVRARIDKQLIDQLVPTNYQPYFYNLILDQTILNEQQLNIANKLLRGAKKAKRAVYDHYCKNYQSELLLKDMQYEFEAAYNQNQLNYHIVRVSPEPLKTLKEALFNIYPDFIIY